MKIFLILTLLLLVSFHANSSGMITNALIDNIHQRECGYDHGFEITLSEPHSNPDSCSSLRTIEISCDHPAISQLSSIALTAMVSQLKVDAWVNGCDAEGQAKANTLRISKDN